MAPLKINTRLKNYRALMNSKFSLKDLYTQCLCLFKNVWFGTCVVLEMFYHGFFCDGFRAHCCSGLREHEKWASIERGCQRWGASDSLSINLIPKLMLAFSYFLYFPLPVKKRVYVDQN